MEYLNNTIDSYQYRHLNFVETLSNLINMMTNNDT